MRLFLLAALLFCSVIAPVAQALDFQVAIPDGSYRGTMQGEAPGAGRIHMVVRSFSGCKACFIALVLQDQGRVVAYQGQAAAITQTNANNQIATASEYTLTPFALDREQQVAPTENPSLVVQVFKDQSQGHVQFQITNALTHNPIGFQKGMMFRHAQKSPFKLVDPETGSFRYPRGLQTYANMSFLKKDDVDHSFQGDFVWYGAKVRHFGGSYALIQDFPSVFTFAAKQTMNVGSEISAIPSFFVFFIEKRKQKMVLMVNPIDSRDVICMKKMGRS